MFNPAAPHTHDPRLIAHLQQITGNDAPQMFEWLRAVRNNVKAEYALVLIGGARTGKGLLLTMVSNLVEPTLVERLPLHFHYLRFLQAGTRIVTLEEPRVADINSLALEALITDPLIELRRGRKSAYTIPNTVNIIIATHPVNGIDASPRFRFVRTQTVMDEAVVADFMEAINDPNALATLWEWLA